MAEQRAFGFVLGVGVASIFAAGAMFWFARQAGGERAVRATYTDVESYCAARVQSVAGEERALRETTCRLTLNGALDSLAAHRFVDSIDQVRAVDALLRDQPTAVSPIASSVQAPIVRDERPVEVQRPTRAEASLPKRVRTKEGGDLMDPFAWTKEHAPASSQVANEQSEPVVPADHSKRASRDVMNPFASPKDNAVDSTPVAAQSAPAPVRSHPRADDLTDPFAGSH